MVRPVARPAVNQASGVEEVAAPLDAGSVLSEVEARLELGARFRAVGLRMLDDQRVSGPGYELTVDGFDPERGVGFEYVAITERGLDVTAAERDAVAADASRRILIIEATDGASLEAAARQFLEALPRLETQP